MKNYRGGILLLPDINEGRKINLKEEVVVNGTGRQGVVKELCEGSYVFKYYVVFPEDSPDSFGHPYNTNEITPVVNP